MKIKQWITLGCLAICAACVAQQALTNDSILKMVKSGLGEDVIVSMIQSQPGDYTITPDAMVALKQAGVTDKELSAMVAKGGTAAAPAPLDAASYDDMDVGVYYKVNGQWTIIPSEPVNWKTGGVLKTIATADIVKGDTNGHLNGPVSSTRLAPPLDFLIKAPDGIEGTDFQLIHLHEEKDSREFRTVTGGVLHASGGSSRDAIQFEQKKVARHVYEVIISNLAAGEYAFLAPGLSGSSASGSTGKAYTFHLKD